MVGSLTHTQMQSDTDKPPDLAGGKDAVSCRITENHNSLASVFAERHVTFFSL